jgi:CRP-like cAMP-binding protein
LLDGMVCRYKDLRSAARQITALHIAGDFVDLHSFSLKRLDHNLLTLTPCRVGLVPHERLLEITETLPHLTRLLWFSTNLDAAIQREWELSLGRRAAIARVAHLFCEMRIRLQLVGLAEESGYMLKITQAELAECTGLTGVHVNRTLKELRERGLLEFQRGTVSIRDIGRLERLAEFDPDYLYLERRPL